MTLADTEKHQDEVHICWDAYRLTNESVKETNVEGDEDHRCSDRLYAEVLGIIEIRRDVSWHFQAGREGAVSSD